MKKQRLEKLEKSRGFTLLEVLTVVVIIGLLLTMVVPAVIGAGEKARVTVAKADLRSISNAMELYRMDNSHYPTTEQGIQALVEKPNGYPEPRKWGPEPYLKKVPLDPWESEYVYANDGVVFQITCLGSDGQEGGEGVAADILLSEL